MKRVVKIIYNIITIAGIFLLAGCLKKDWFDVKFDKQQSVPTTMKDLQALLDNGGLFNICPISGENASDSHIINPAEESSLAGMELNTYVWSKKDRSQHVVDWGGGQYGSYSRIYTTNLILESLDKIIPMSEAERLEYNNIRGAAHFYRGKSFFELAELFVPPFNRATEADKLGIPLRLESDVTIKSVRSTVKETYDQIINDLIKSVELLPIKQQFKTRPTKVAAYALLSRIYLSLENYPEAKKYSELALNLFQHLLDYQKLNYNSTRNPFQPYNDETIFYSYMSGFEYFTVSGIFVNKSLYDLYEAEDLRKKAFFNYNRSTDIVTYKGSYSGRGFSFFNGLATDELYLIRAECNAREGNHIAAMEDLNRLLRMRWTSEFIDKIASNAEEALILVLVERRKELIFRGVRWSDLRRLNKDPRFALTLYRNHMGVEYKIEPNSYKYTFPIPDDVIEMSGMQQNPGW